jgi:hypothetical protein
MFIDRNIQYSRVAIFIGSGWVTRLDVLVEAMPQIRGKRGRPLHKPKILQGDRRDSSELRRQRLPARGIRATLAKIGAPTKRLSVGLCVDFLDAPKVFVVLTKFRNSFLD